MRNKIDVLLIYLHYHLTNGAIIKLGRLRHQFKPVTLNQNSKTAMTNYTIAPSGNFRVNFYPSSTQRGVMSHRIHQYRLIASINTVDQFFPPYPPFSQCPQPEVPLYPICPQHASVSVVPLAHLRGKRGAAVSKRLDGHHVKDKKITLIGQLRQDKKGNIRELEVWRYPLG